MLTPSEEIQEQIDRYLNDELTSAERSHFEDRIKTDAALSKEIDTQRKALFLIKAKAIADFKNKLNDYSQGLKPTLETPFFQRWYTWAAAASIVLATTFYFYTTQTPFTEKLFIAYYEPATIERQITRGDVTVDEKTTAFEAYARENYPDALRRFEALIHQQPADEIIFYAGASALAAGNTEKAITYLTNVVQRKGPYQWRGQWYLSLAYLKANNVNDAKATLTLLCSQPNSYSNKAKIILNELEN